MAFSILSLSMVVLFVSLGGTQLLGLVAGDDQEPLPGNFITWHDLRVEHYFGRLKLSDKDNSSRVIVVAKDGLGDSITVQGAIDLVPEFNTQRVKILILPGIYRERVVVPRTKPYISLISYQSCETVISWNTKASDRDSGGHETGTFNTATVDVESDYFCATGITFENTVVAVPGGKGMQAVALKVAGDKAVFFRVRVLGSQDTLLDLSGSHYFYQCYIQGSVDFIFGNARSLYQDCVLHSTAGSAGAIAASHRDSIIENTGFSFVNCKVNGTGSIYLGRAWGRYSRAIYSYCDFDGIITPRGWSDWGDPSRRRTVWFGEYQCRGMGANLRRRVRWAKSFSYEQAKPFLDMNFIDGDEWLRL
ncbi:Pectinesterase [Macleaya cordata]|uniref:Pectinesterase n=1 Tax=Macleaya cordata TaxID=56857 RepID=A0A200RBR7_MACCD|nr:Pectinesterase [Macleaya cordata]